MNPLAQKKVLVFAALGAAGCLIGWVAGEGLLAVGLPTSEAEKQGPSLVSRPEAAPPAPPPQVERPGSTTPPNPSAPVVPKRNPPPPLPPEVQKALDAAGGKSGQIQLTLSWRQQTDLDLHCIDPNGEEIYFSHKKAEKGSRGELDVDKLGGTEQQVENIRFLNSAPPGRYRVFVKYYGGSSGATPYTVSVLVVDKRSEFKGVLAKEDGKRLIHEFDLTGLRVGVPPEVVVYRGGKNKFRVRLEREPRDDQPVKLTFGGESSGLRLPAEVAVRGDQDDVEFDVEAEVGATVGERRVRVIAEGRHGKVEVEAKVTVRAPPVSLQLAASKSVAFSAGGGNKLPVRIAREGFDGPVRVRATVPAGVTAPEVTIPAGRDDGELALTAAETATVGSFAVALAAEGGTARADAQVTLELAAPPPPAPPPPPPAPSWSLRLVLVIALWTALLAVGLSLALVAGQNSYLGRPWLSGREAGVLLAGGGVAGLVAGGIGQTLLGLLTRAGVMPEIGFLAGWLLLGGLLGRGVGFFIPNLHPVRAALAGVIGGFLGAVAFILISKLGAAPGRFVGAAILGGCIGLMVALVELAFRVAWLEVHYSASEVITVNLGAEPVKIGGSNTCTIWARGAAPLALRIWVEDGKVLCEDAVNQTIGPLSNGESRRAGALEVVVRTGSGDEDERPAAKPAPKASKAAPKPAKRARPAEDEDDPLPLPLETGDDFDPLPLPPAPKPKPTPSGVRAPLPPPPAAPPPPPAPPAPAARPVASGPVCPHCGGKVAPGARSCFLCGENW